MKFLKIICFAAIFFSLFSCKKELLGIKETDFIGGDVALQTVANNESEVVGAYTQLNPEMAILLNATFSDEVKVGEFYNSATTHEWQFGSTDVTIRDNFVALYPLYRAIDRVNRVLQAIPVAKAATTSDEATRTRVRGEALFIRAYSHFELARYYAGNYDPNGLALTYMETPALATQARIKMEPYYAKIIADIDTAKMLLPDNLTDKYRANRLSAVALRARVALYMRDWPTAISQSTEFINAIPLASRATFPGIWTDANSNEVSFKLARTVSSLGSYGVRPGSLFRGISTKNAAGDTLIGSVTWLASDKLWNSYDKVNDIRFPSYFKDEPLLSSKGRPSHLVAKYSGTGYTSPSENVNDIKIFRTAEMYLIRAEAKEETNDLAGAASDINTLRAARINGYTNVSYASKDAAITDIMLERFKELAYEGHRFWDLRRRNLPVERLASDAPSANGLTLPAGSFRFVLPIPNVEIQANPLYVQNPGY